MSIGVFIAVLGAALLHASWNALIKSGADKQTGMFILSVGHGVFGLMLIPFFDWPSANVWPWLVASWVIHTAYQLLLAYAYSEGDLSRVYPISRGAAPMIVLVISLLAGIDAVRGTEVLGLVILGAGIAMMARGALIEGESRRMLPFAFGAAVATAGYTLVDGLGAREWGVPLGYVGWLFVGSGLLYTPAIVVLRGRAVLRASARVWAMGLLASALSCGAYAIAIWAMTVAPIALVAALRETSILFAVLIGWLVMGDPLNRSKAVAAGLIVAGVIVTRI